MRKTTRRRGRAGSSPRRSSLTAGAGACAVLIRAGRPQSAGPHGAAHLIPIPKTTQRRSRAGSSPIRSSPNGGAAAWAASPRAAAADRHRPLAEVPRARRRHQRSSQLSRRAPSVLRAAPLPRVVTRGVRPLLSRRRPPLVRPAQQRSRSSAAYCGGCGSAPHKRRRAPCASRGSRQRSARCKSSCTQPCCLTLSPGHHCHHCGENRESRDSSS